MSLLSIENLTVRFGTTTAVRDVSLEVSPGQVTGVLGANGAGKTTTLLGILGRVERVSGRIVLDGQDVSTMSTVQLVRAGISLCPEGRRLFPNMTVQDNLLLGAYGRGRRTERSRLLKTYERFPFCHERRNELAGRLSGGQQQIVAVARALMSAPRLLLLDEPSSGLSPVAIEEIRKILAAITEDGTAVLLVEQNVSLVSTLCADAYVLAHGEVRDAGKVADLLAGVRLSDSYLGVTDGPEED